MRRNYRLEPLGTAAETVEFDWDPDSGEIGGRDASAVLDLVDEAEARGTVMGHPYPTSFAVADVLHSEAEMALVLGQYWRLPEELQRAYPRGADDLPAGALA